MAKSESKKDRKSSSFFLFSGQFWAHTFFRILIALLVVGGGWMLFSMARDKAVSLDDFKFSLSSLDLAQRPAWVRGILERQIGTIPNSGEEISLLDPNATRKVASALMANPWVRDVKSVVREFPNRVRAEVELRDPAAFVLTHGVFYIVDSEGVRLPGEYTDQRTPGLDLLMIRFVYTATPPAGKVWEDPAVVEGARLAASLKKNADVVKAARIVAIDTSNIGSRRSPREPEIILVTADQTSIYWGRGVNSPSSTELSADKKIENLRAVLAREGSLAEKEYVDLRFPNPVFRDRKYYLGSL